MSSKYTTQLGAGLGMIEETRILLDLWDRGMSARSVFESALQSGAFPNMSARRLRNFVVECFAPRYLNNGGEPAKLLKDLNGTVQDRELAQLMFLFTCRANLILADFVREIYWNAYSAGHDYLNNKNAYQFVFQAKDEGKTTTNWSENMVSRVSGYLTGCLADFGLLERGRKQDRRILPYRIGMNVVTILSHDLHFSGFGDNRLLTHPDWMLFGMDRNDVLDEMKRLTLNDLVLVQSAGEAIRIEWRYTSMGELTDVLTQS